MFDWQNVNELPSDCLACLPNCCDALGNESIIFFLCFAYQSVACFKLRLNDMTLLSAVDRLTVDPRGKHTLSSCVTALQHTLLVLRFLYLLKTVII